ncbi:heme NO-binding domain-containing protein [Jannaschia sp. LMIT008]|uniref:heme NO-binding domain-containing protein n=1 Tax=Jannaschia maritima TaxID=3032585 RepID=UPI00281228E1|nr:heme NO-binding domain-containing protein [Jannaschia sp. LMIT008]
MHGIICKAVETYLTAQYGQDSWARIAEDAGFDALHFEAVRIYDDSLIRRIFEASTDVVGVRPAALLEDMGTWICTHPPLEPVRRLFRFSGATFEEMLFALDEVHERARMALPDLELPVLSLIEMGGGKYRVASTWATPGAGAVVIGILRAMADDYGVLAFLEFETGAEVNGAWAEIISISTLDESFAAPREFSLGGAA